MSTQRRQTEIHTNIINVNERPLNRADVPVREAMALEFLEDPIAFAQNVQLLLSSNSMLEDFLCPPTPKLVGDTEEEMKDILHEAIRRRVDHDVLHEIAGELDDLIHGALNDAGLYGVAQGVVLKQLHQGLLGIAALRYAGHNHVTENYADAVRKAREVLEGTRAPRATIGTAAKGSEEAA